MHGLAGTSVLDWPVADPISQRVYREQRALVRDFLHWHNVNFRHDGVDALMQQWARNKAWLFPILGNDLMVDHEPSLDRSVVRDLMGDYGIHGLLKYVSIDAMISGYVGHDGNRVKIGKYLKNMEGVTEESLRLLAKVRERIASLSKGKVRLSVRPVDLLAISDVASFSSCMSLASGAAGPLAYAIDGHTMVAYAFKSHQNGLPYKEWRQLVYVGKADRADLPDPVGVIFGDQYPHENSEIAESVRGIVKDGIRRYLGGDPFHCENREVPPIISSPQEVHIGTSLYEGREDVLSTLVRIPKSRCLICGNEGEGINCCGLDFVLRCHQCRCRLSEDGARMPSTIGPVCHDCGAGFYSCADCKRNMPPDSVERFDGLPYCHVCIAQFIRICYLCRYRHPMQYSHRTARGLHLCLDCAGIYRECPGCASIIHREQTTCGNGCAEVIAVA